MTKFSPYSTSEGIVMKRFCRDCVGIGAGVAGSRVREVFTLTAIWFVSALALLLAAVLTQTAMAGPLPAGMNATPTVTTENADSQLTVSDQTATVSESASTTDSQNADPSSSALTVSQNKNASRLTGNHLETAIAIDPTNPDKLFVASNTEVGSGPGSAALFAAFSTDGGFTWPYVDDTDGTIADGDLVPPLPVACCDPSVAWDEFGNLFLAYVDFAGGPTHVALSTDGGMSFSLIATLGTDTDQPTITTGPGSVWITYAADFPYPIVARGAAVTGWGSVGAFSDEQVMPNSNNCNYGDIAVDPNGQVLVTCQDFNGLSPEGPGHILVSLDPDGLGGNGFNSSTIVITTNVGYRDSIPAQPERPTNAEAGLAWDRSGGPHDGRVYLVYTDELIQENNDTDIFVVYSDDDGATWNFPDPLNPDKPVNDDTTVNSQFLPRIALDQTTGFLAVSWYDCRNDDGGTGPGNRKAGVNNDAQLFASASTDGGITFQPNVQVSTGTSTEDVSQLPGTCCADLDYGDYQGLAYEAGYFYPA
jgi:hypothetical protein